MSPKNAARIGPAPPLGQYLAVSAAYFIAYVLVNVGTDLFEQFDNTTVTIWSPDNGLSVLLLLQSSLYTPVVLVSALLTDLFIAHSHVDPLSIFAADFIVTQGYLLIAIILRDAFRFDFRQPTYANMIALLAVVPASAAVTSLLYCGVLYITGALPGHDVYNGLVYFWIGDAVGMIVLIPAAAAVYDLAHNREWIRLINAQRLAALASLALALMFLIVASVLIPDSRYLFNLLFLPTIWVGIVYGFNAVALVLFVAQLLLVAAVAIKSSDLAYFASFQTQMFILAATGQLLGAAVSEREDAMRSLRKQQFDLARLTSQATTGALAAAFAHEVSQPLSSLSSYVHAARRMMANGEEPQRAMEALQRAEAEARRARDIVGRIREFVASGRLDEQEFDLTEVARKIVSLNNEDARARGVQIQLIAAEDAIVTRGDRIAIEQALNNLVVNAVDAAAAHKGEGMVEVRAASEAGLARLVVEDNGPGVAEEIGAHMFEPFETTKRSGMGLGLTLVKHIVDKHSGRVSWRLREPHGAVFIIELPRHAELQSAE